MASLISNVGTFNNLTDEQKETLETYASGTNMPVMHSMDGTSTITFPDNTYFKAFQALCKGFKQTIRTVAKQSMSN
jgi:hypothetical protein